MSQFMVTGVSTDQVTVLNAVVALLKASVPELSGDNTCFLSLHTDPIENQRQNIYATVAPMSGQYDEPLFAGMGVAVEHSGVIVTVFSQMRLDRPDGDTSMLTDQTRGLLPLKQSVLKALNGAMLQDPNSNNILLSAMRPVNSSHPSRADEKLGTFSLAFTTDFQWNLN